ncbi:unnamed protein product [Thlaspi arvense]|uniref:Uncharacterized protein n=1 Tax=Thlaspi arvense TaxID=13288 RepID=A0AAU9TAD1_THLAR|nr:unnamed protein product [Thlaspi arvense]
MTDNGFSPSIVTYNALINGHCVAGKMEDAIAVLGDMKEELYARERFVCWESDDVHYVFAGNAQSITRNRWIHHTSFLWDYSESNISRLQEFLSTGWKETTQISFVE